MGANALIVSGRIGAVDHYDLAMHIAAEIFRSAMCAASAATRPTGLSRSTTCSRRTSSIRFHRSKASAPATRARTSRSSPGTWRPTASCRSRAATRELIAGGLALLLEGRLAQDAVLLSTLTTSSFAGLAIAMVPWLLVGGTLALHQPFDPDTFLAQRQTLRCDTVIVPGPLVSRLAEAGHLAGGDGLTNVIGVWRTPNGSARAALARCQGAHARCACVRRDRDHHRSPRRRRQAGGDSVRGRVRAARGEGHHRRRGIAATPNGTVALRGPMVPRAAFPPGVERSGMPFFQVAANGFVDTGYACLPDNAAMVVTGPPPGIVSCRRLSLCGPRAEDLVALPENGAGSLAALPDALAGHRLAGTAADRDLVQQSLARLGANPLLVSAFRDRAQRTDERRPTA